GVDRLELHSRPLIDFENRGLLRGRLLHHQLLRRGDEAVADWRRSLQPILAGRQLKRELAVVVRPAIRQTPRGRESQNHSAGDRLTAISSLNRKGDYAGSA